MNNYNIAFNSTFNDNFLSAKRSDSKKKSLSISSPKSAISQVKTHPSKKVSLISPNVTTLNAKPPLEEGCIIEKILENHSPNDSFTQDLLEIEGKKILEKLSESIYETTKGEYFINAKRFMMPNKKIKDSFNIDNEVIVQLHKYQTSAEGINSLILNTTKETDSKGSHHSNHLAFSPASKTDNANLYKGFITKASKEIPKPLLSNRNDIKSNDNPYNDLQEKDNKILSFVTKRSAKPKENNILLKKFIPQKKLYKADQPKANVSKTNKSTNISLLPMPTPTSKAIQTFFDDKLKKSQPLKPSVLYCSVKANSKSITVKPKKSLQKKLTKKSTNEGHSTKTDYSNKNYSELAQEDIVHSRIFTHSSNRGIIDYSGNL